MNHRQSTSGGPRKPCNAQGRAKHVELEAGCRIINPRAAGIDIGSREHYVAVPGRSVDEPEVRSFGCYTPHLHEMAQWLHEHGITTVAIESTGVYWIPVMEVLEPQGFEVMLINPEGLKQIKTDVKDCRALQRLHSFGLLRGSFRPPQDIVALRAYWRQRTRLVGQSSEQILLMHKALEQMNLQLHKAVSDVSGVSGMRIIRAIIDGQHDPAELARLRHGSTRATEKEMIQALCGNYRAEHLFSLRQAVEGYDFVQRQIAACDEAMAHHMRLLAPQKATPGTPPPSAPMHRRKNQPYVCLHGEQVRLLGVDLCKIPGVSTLTVQTVLSEVGTDFSKFPTEKHFASWLGLCPNNRKTGGRIIATRTRHVANRVATALRVAAQALERSQTSLGAFYRRLKTRKGPAKAITATAHKLACLIYRMVTHGEEYVELGLDYYEQRYRERILQNLKKRARTLGYALLDPQTGQFVS